jgi:DNA-binding IclR family transcriptional regulator
MTKRTIDASLSAHNPVKPSVAVKNVQPDLHALSSVEKAMLLLNCFEVGDSYVSLAQLNRRSGLNKSTLLRLARVLANWGYLVQRPEDGAWRLGPAAGWLGARYQASHDVDQAIGAALLDLSQLTQETASFFIREGNLRTCLVRIEGPKAIRHHIRVGEPLPLERGSPGRVLLAYTGQPGPEYETIRQQGYGISIGERDSEIASISAPVFGSNWQLLGVISISGPANRLNTRTLSSFAKPILSKASQLSYELSQRQFENRQIHSNWHP